MHKYETTLRTLAEKAALEGRRLNRQEMQAVLLEMVDVPLDGRVLRLVGTGPDGQAIFQWEELQ